MVPKSSSDSLELCVADASKSVIGDSLETSLSLLDLRSFTSARVALARAGTSIRTRDTLAFALDHARARDAVYATLSLPAFIDGLHARGMTAIQVKSAATDRRTYLRRPDLGRTLSEASKGAIAEAAPPAINQPEAPGKPRMTIILADGLSALAIDRYGIAVLDELIPAVREDWILTPIVIAEQARVALGDEIGVALGAQLTLMLIGERPGLSAADSLGAYITWAPRIGCTNAERNCVSNIRGGGLSPLQASEILASYLQEAKRLRLSGVQLRTAPLNRELM